MSRGYHNPDAFYLNQECCKKCLMLGWPWTNYAFISKRSSRRMEQANKEEEEEERRGRMKWDQCWMEAKRKGQSISLLTEACNSVCVSPRRALRTQTSISDFATDGRRISETQKGETEAERVLLAEGLISDHPKGLYHARGSTKKHLRIQRERLGKRVEIPTNSITKLDRDWQKKIRGRKLAGFTYSGRRAWGCPRWPSRGCWCSLRGRWSPWCGRRPSGGTGSGRRSWTRPPRPWRTGRK